MELKVIGITSGVGSLQYGFRKEGFKVLHSHEWRKYYDLSGTYSRNYGCENLSNYDPVERFKGVDCIVSHPECGNFSNLYTGKNRDARNIDPGDIYKFIDLCQKYEPKTFLVDNLPKSLMAVTRDDWEKSFPDYKLYFEMISNWGYGNIQKNRNRLFIIGVHKDLDWFFVPNERAHNKKLIDAISDIDDNTPNHQKMKLTDLTQWSGYQIGIKKEGKLTLQEMQPWFDLYHKNSNLPYYNRKGEMKLKPGYGVVSIEKTAPVLSGGGGFYDNYWIFDEYYRPLTMRERLRIQGFEDDFILSPLNYQYSTKEHLSLIKQTGKCMPVQFPQEFARQLSDYLLNGIKQEFKASRLLKQPFKNKQLNLF